MRRTATLLIALCMALAAAAQAAMVHAASSVTPSENVAAYRPYFAKYQEINNLLLKTF